MLMYKYTEDGCMVNVTEKCNDLFKMMIDESKRRGAQLVAQFPQDRQPSVGMQGHPTYTIQNLAMLLAISCLRNYPLASDENGVFPIAAEADKEAFEILHNMNKKLSEWLVANPNPDRMCAYWRVSDIDDVSRGFHFCLTTIFMDGTAHEWALERDFVLMQYFTNELEYVNDTNKKFYPLTPVRLTQESLETYSRVLDIFAKELLKVCHQTFCIGG